MHNKLTDCLKIGEKVFLGKNDVLLKSLLTFISGGHVLIEDVPGVGKTTLALLLSKLLGLDFSRIQMTSDLMPSDILGSLIYDSKQQEFRIDKGPIFHEMILADELNRTSAKTQSAFLQAMEERQVSIDEKTFDLGENFFVVATQNPLEQYGTFPLPESHLDRFDICLHVGQLTKEDEILLLKGEKRKTLLDKLESTISRDDILGMRAEIEKVFISDEIYDFIWNILDVSRQKNDNGWSGLSPRVGITLLRLVKAYAYYDDRKFVVPEDILFWLPSVMNHRLYFMQSDSIEKRIDWVDKFITKLEK